MSEAVTQRDPARLRLRRRPGRAGRARGGRRARVRGARHRRPRALVGGLGEARGRGRPRPRAGLADDGRGAAHARRRRQRAALLQVPRCRRAKETPRRRRCIAADAGARCTDSSHERRGRRRGAQSFAAPAGVPPRLPHLQLALHAQLLVVAHRAHEAGTSPAGTRTVASRSSPDGKLRSAAEIAFAVEHADVVGQAADVVERDPQLRRGAGHDHAAGVERVLVALDPDRPGRPAP